MNKVEPERIPLNPQKPHKSDDRASNYPSNSLVNGLIQDMRNVSKSMLLVSPPLLLIQTPASRVPHSWCCGHPGPPSRSKGLQCWRLATRAGPVVRTVDAVTAAYCQCGSLLGGAEVGTNTAGHRPYMDRLTGYFFISRAVLLYPSERGAHVEQNGNR